MQKGIPNFITLLRVALIPVLVASFYIKANFAHYLVVCIFIFASITDFLDGFLARVWSAQSNFGAMLDPIADKLLVAVTLVMMIDKGIADTIPILVILCREILVSGMREYLGQMKFSVTSLSKFKTAIQMISITVLLIGETNKTTKYINLIGNMLLWIAAILTVATGYYYLKKALKVCSEIGKTKNFL